MSEIIYTCKHCRKSWKPYWNKNKVNLPISCRYCKSLKWNIPRQPKGKNLFEYLMKLKDN